MDLALSTTLSTTELEEKKFGSTVTLLSNAMTQQKPQEIPFWTNFTAKFREEYICLKCKKIRNEKTENCPDCGGVMCVRIVSQRL
jgi:hypothetical protein